MTSLVIYYSRSGKTREVAEVIKEEKNADIVEIKEKSNRSGALGFIKGAVDSVRNAKTEITPTTVDLSGYDTVYIGTPVWASKPAPAIIKLIENCNFNGVKVITFATMMSSGGDKTVKTMNDSIKIKGGEVLKSFSIITKGTDISSLTKKAL